MNSTELTNVESKLDTIIKLLALVVASDNHSLKERALRLQRAGMNSKEIAELCDTTRNTVSVLLSKAKRSSKSTSK